MLSRPRGSEQHSVRDFLVAEWCVRCNNTTCVLAPREFWGPREVSKRVFVPTSIVADATLIAARHAASKEWDIKPSCADIQLLNLVAGVDDAALRRALLTVGVAAIISEHTLLAGTFWERVYAKHCANGPRPSAWRLVKASSNCSQDSSSPPTPFSDKRGPFRGDDGDVDDGGESGHAVRPVFPDPADNFRQAAVATIVEEQQRAYVEGHTLHSTTTMTGEGAQVPLPPGLEGGVATGAREARGRFPVVTESENYLHSNNPTNLQAAHDLRNVGIGNHNPLETEAQTRDALVEQLLSKLFTPNNVQKAMTSFVSIRATALPKKMSEAAKEQAERDALNAITQGDAVGFSTVVKAFVKSEVTGKNKPRPIANHGEVRLFALAKVAFIFEHVMFDKLQKSSIKERPKAEAIGEILWNMHKMREGAFVENDLTAFEFGISEPLKQIEQKVLRHIGGLIGLEDVGQTLFDRVVDDRDKCVTWQMKYRDATGMTQTAKIKLGQTMRESGDRITSSGNFFQNLIAWFSYLVDPDHVSDAFDSLLAFRGARMFYVSPRDKRISNVRGCDKRKKYLCCLAFEGDDTLGRFEETLWPINGDPCMVGAFFERWGWRAKLVWKPLKGDTYVRFVGYEALIHDCQVVYENGKPVMTPETKRFLKTKAWTASTVTPQELKTCIRIFAATLAQGYVHVEPMHAFLKAMYDDNAGGVDVDASKVREYILAATGKLPEHNQVVAANVPFPHFEGGCAYNWKRLLRVAAGEFQEREWALMCHIGSMQQHGADLATSVPASWRA